MTKAITLGLVAAVFSVLCVLLAARGPDWAAPAVISALACTVVCLVGIVVDAEREQRELEDELHRTKTSHALVPQPSQVLALQSLCSETARALRSATPDSELGRLRERLRQAGEL